MVLSCISGGDVRRKCEPRTARISPRTARLHTSRLVGLGVLDVQRLFPASKFRLGRQPGDEGQVYLDRWEKASEVYGA